MQEIYCTRRFEDVLDSIWAVGDEVLNEHLEDAKNWKEDERWFKLNECVSNWLPLDSSDCRSIRILAILWGCTEKEAKSKLCKHGY